MSPKKTRVDLESQDRLITEVRRHQAQQEQTYRGHALKLYPWICGRCGHKSARQNAARAHGPSQRPQSRPQPPGRQ